MPEFGIFQGASVGPRPWDVTEPKRLREDVEMGVVADEVGFDYFWAPEHHCLEDYSHNSCSHLTCLAVGMRTQRIRVATGIFNICPPINHPVRVAEQIATIDILTHGRVDLGTGRGSGSTEVETFGVTTDESRAMWDEAIRAIPRMWTQELFSWQGKYFSVPERCILPKPVQKPHPPLWVTASNPGTVELGGRMGLGVAVFSFQDPELLRPLVETYKKAVARAEPVGAFVNNRIMAIAPLLCMEDGAAARRLYSEVAGRVAPYFSVYFDTIPHNAARTARERHPIPQSRIRELVAEAAADPQLKGPYAVGEVTAEFLYQNGICVGSPDEIAPILQRYLDVGLDQVVFFPVIAWGVSRAVTLESIRLTGRKVLPRLR
jgi:alkanesulfonate monooxygenase SsuD/methylene tetrahydromethanopterin reductase-like flavin-dependent oxidoreductase (luciferase family)